jgi:hypothetical protein
MNLLKSVQTSLLGKSKWALLGGVLLWMSVAVATPAHAIPTNYVITPGGFFTGSFTLDPTSITSGFSAWSIDPITIIPIFTGLSPLSHPVVVNFGLGTTAALQQYEPISKHLLFFNVDLSTLRFTASASQDGGANSIAQIGAFSQVTSVPEPTALVLLAISMLALAGSRWLPSRREN